MENISPQIHNIMPREDKAYGKKGYPQYEIMRMIESMPGIIGEFDKMYYDFRILDSNMSSLLANV